MATNRRKSGGGFASVAYVARKSVESGNPVELFRRMLSRNTCKTCALGMGGQRGGMRDEAGRFPEFCKKSVQASAGDMGRVVTEHLLRSTPLSTLTQLGSSGLEKLGRLTFPIIAEEGDTHFRRIGWEEALSRTSDSLRAAPPKEVFFYASGRSSNEAAFLLQLVARAYGTPNIHNCSYYCHSASGVALGRVYGSGTASVVLDDLSHTDLAIVAGANPASNHPRLITRLVELRRHGGKVIVVNPLREPGMERFRIPSDWRSMIMGSRVSDLYLQPHVGTDIALFKAILKGVLEQAGVDREFVRNNTTGWEAVREDVGRASWNELLDACGVSRADVDHAVRLLIRAKNGIFLWAMGLTHHEHGVDNITALTNLALSRGWLGRKGCGLLPIRGHSNVQGVGSVGVSPVLKRAFAEKMEEAYGIEIPREPGQDTYGSMLAAEEGRIRSAVLFGGNLFASNPDRNWAAKALGNIPFTLSITTKLNEGHVVARGLTSIVVPVLARDEEAQETTQESMFNFVRFSDGGRPSVTGEMRSEVEVVSSLAERILPGDRFDWNKFRSHDELRKQIGRVVPGFEAIGGIDGIRKEFQIAGRTFHEPKFATPTGKAAFHVTPLPAFKTASGEFRLMTLRSEGQFNTVVYEEEDIYRGNKRRDIVMMAEEDAERLGLVENDRVEVETEVGSLEVSVSLADLPPGNLAMYYPEANVLVPRRLDSQSGTPAFKSIRALLKPL